MSLRIPFDNSYARLPEHFYARLSPLPVPRPEFVTLNEPLVRDLRLDFTALSGKEGLAVFSGNAVPHNATPIAQAYAGHQFGGWVPQLGDGRALLLGEVIDRNGIRQDIQLKGSGRTPFSRGGDGRAWLGPVLREYVVSEAMHALGIPTTRALAAVTTGEQILRETMLPGAIVTRVATSHIRVGTFQYFAARHDEKALKTLSDYVMDRHYPQATSPLDLLQAVVRAQADLLAQWMGVGFIHGVMNTDNCHIAGLTIDYGPCAFMDGYDPAQVYSSIDVQGRYAYQNQPNIAMWNLAQFATCLLPLMGDDRDTAVAQATEAVEQFAARFKSAWLAVFGAKIGLAAPHPADAALINDLLGIMAAQKADFTNTFRGLADGTARGQFADPAQFDAWEQSWKTRQAQNDAPAQQSRALLQSANPAFIARNHRIEQAIIAAQSGDFTLFHRLLRVLQYPFDDQPDDSDLRHPPADSEIVRQTFCGT